MIDLRYHIYSLVAVFLALALGILIGALLIAPGTPDSKEALRRRTQIVELEKRFDTLREDISRKQALVSATQAQLDQTEQVCKALMPSAVNGRLAGRNVAIVQTSGSDEATAAVRSALTQAGAKVTVFIRVEDALTSEDQELEPIAASLGMPPNAKRSDLYNTALSAVANCLVWARGADKLQEMERNDLISVSGNLTHWNRLVVLVGGAESEDDNRAQTLDLPLIEAIQDAGGRVVGCECYKVPVSYIGAYAGKGVSTVDNIDQAAGQIGLIYALAGERGNFGVKDTADRLIPRTMESELH